MTNRHRIENCPACGKPFPVIDLGGVGRCHSCDHRSIVEVIGTDKYDDEYYDKYVGYEMTPLGAAITEHRWFLVGLYANNRDRILDYGCGAGAFVHDAPLERDFVVAGYDVNPRSPFGHKEVLEADWDIVTMWDVIEHLPDPLDVLKRLKTDRLFILTPDITCPNARREIEFWRHFRRDEHQHYFSPTSLTKMAYLAGFRLVGMDRTEAMMRNPSAPQDLMTMWFEREQR